ncbi:DUF4760 domain-containing protein [Vitreimonas sp.]|uniref:DUF4760 domain-containing protein n=1 Tax=Vitreimonas sp. TaxID=3069702 RepID=UPI002ED9E8F3
MALDPQLTSQLALAFAGALMGALFGGFARWTGAHNDRRLRLTLDLYNEFHSPLFNHVRIAAHDALSGGASMPAAYASASIEQREAIASVVHFWEKVAQLLRVGALDEKLLRRFFGQYARWWSELLCEKQGALADPEWGATLTDINYLFGRLKRTKREGSRR